MRYDLQLTYDSKLEMLNYEIAPGGFWTVTVTTSPDAASKCLQQLSKILEDIRDHLRKFDEPYFDGGSVDSAKSVLVNRFNSETFSVQQSVDQLMGLQLPQMEMKTKDFLRDYPDLLMKVSPSDVNKVLSILGESDSDWLKCTGISKPSTSHIKTLMPSRGLTRMMN
eukprot:GHVL01031144.1.p1 GENE.GHVL01031144.1~~GHVL01031144.1.p1  ORF type:complete len:167 (-),score=26.50 GHVL01031144.1:1916-2416(-)